MSRMRGVPMAGAIFLFALALRLAVIAADVVPLAPDSETYLLPARALLAGRGYADETGRPYAGRAPTYPLFLLGTFLLFGESVRAVQIAQAFLGAGLAAGAFLYLRRRGEGPAGVAAGLLLAVDPALVPAPAHILTETLGTVLLFALVVALERCASGGPTTSCRWPPGSQDRSEVREFESSAGDEGEPLQRRVPANVRTPEPSNCRTIGGAGGNRGAVGIAPFIAGGLLAGALAMNTPITVLLLPALVGVLAAARRVGRRDMARWGLCLLVAGLLVGGWAARNRQVMGGGVPLQAEGFGVLVWATTAYDFDWLPSQTSPHWAPLEREYRETIRGRSSREADALFLRKAWGNFRARPLLVLGRVAKANFWFWAESPGSHQLQGYPGLRIATLAFQELRLLALAASLWVFWRRGELRDRILWVGAVGYFAFFLAPMFPIPRYYVPVLPAIDVLIAGGCAPALASLARGRRAAYQRGEGVRDLR